MLKQRLQFREMAGGCLLREWGICVTDCKCADIRGTAMPVLLPSSLVGSSIKSLKLSKAMLREFSCACFLSVIRGRMISALKFFRNRFFLAGALVMALGLCAAAAIFIAVEMVEIDQAAEFPGGTVYVAPPEDTKRYRHELERFGGKAAVMADDLNRWFVSLWHGKRLAFTVGVLAFLLALILFRKGRCCEGRKEGVSDEQAR